MITNETRRSAWPRDFLAAIVLAGSAFGLLMATGGIWDHVGGWDLHGAFLPKYIEASRALFQEGRLPLWNPYEFCGAPMFATIQGLVAYLPVPVLFAVLSPYWALQGLYAVNLIVLAWGIVAYLRKHGIGRPAAALAFFVSVAGCFTSYSMVGLDHPNFLASVAWVPWMLLCLEHALEKGERPWLGLFALAAAAQWLAGYPDFPIDTAVLVGVIALVSVGGTWIRRSALAVAGVSLGIALVGFQVLPLAEAIAESVRGRDVDTYATTRLLYRIHTLGLWDPLVVQRFGFAGIALAVMSLSGFSRARLGWLLALVWAIFAVEPPLGWIYLLPGFSGMRNALGWSHLFPVFFGFLAAAGAWSAWSRGSTRWRTVAVVLSVAALFPWARTIYESPSRHVHRGPDYDLIAKRVPVLRSLQERLPGKPRIVSQLEMDSGTMARERISSAAGYDPTMPPYRVRRLIDWLNGRDQNTYTRVVAVGRNPDLGALLGVGILAVDRKHKKHFQALGYRAIRRLPPSDVILYREPVPRVRLVHDAVVARNEEESLRKTVDRVGDLRHMTVLELEEGEPPPLAPAPPGVRETLDVVIDEPELVQIEADLAAPGLLAITDTHYPGWTADVGGEPLEILRADYAFRAVALPAGKHVVTFRYRPASLRIGGVVSLLAAAVTLWLLIPPRRRERAPRSTGPVPQ